MGGDDSWSDRGFSIFCHCGDISFRLSPLLCVSETASSSNPTSNPSKSGGGDVMGVGSHSHHSHSSWYGHGHDDEKLLRKVSSWISAMSRRSDDRDNSNSICNNSYDIRRKLSRPRIVTFEYPPISSLKQVHRYTEEEAEKLFFSDDELDNMEYESNVYIRDSTLDVSCGSDPEEDVLALVPCRPNRTCANANANANANIEVMITPPPSPMRAGRDMGQPPQQQQQPDQPDQHFTVFKDVTIITPS